MILAILQARVSSSRLPGKVLKPILNKPMILHEIERIQRSGYIDQLILATSTDPSDDPLAELCIQNNVEIHRGSLEDVLDRFYQATQKYKPDHMVRLTGDCPVIDWELIDKVIALHLREKNDYTSNALNPTYPDGLDVEVCTVQALQTAWKNAGLPSEREHVTVYIHQHPELFQLGGLTNESDLSSLRWTVDEAADFALITQIYEHLYQHNKDFKLQDIIELLQKHPELKNLNKQYQRNEGLEKSMRADQEFCKRRL